VLDVSDAVLIGEADVEVHQLGDFFGEGDQLHMLYNFFLNNYLFLALAQGRAAPIHEALRKLPPLPEAHSGSIFAKLRRTGSRTSYGYRWYSL
jgi:hypothetical protein